MSLIKRLLQALALLAFISCAAAQSWPTKPVRFVVSFPPGGPLDGLARAVGQSLSPALGQPVVVDNRPGALGTIGSEAAARSPADGHTVLVASSGGHALTPAIMTLKFDPLKDLPPLMGVARSEMVLVTGKNNKGVPLQDFLKQSRAKKDNTVGGIGTGSTNHLVGELFKRAAGIQGTHVPYQGGAPLALAVMSGEVDFAVLDVGAVLTHIQAGNIVPMLVASPKRSAFLPDVPTMSEAGLAGVTFENVYGLFLPAGVPKDVQEKLYAATASAMETASVKEQLNKLGLVPSVMTRAELDAIIKSQAEALVPMARELKIRVD
jgi:tripartite-type tricarboxylate transporter receptor subunit TctC